MNEFILLKGLRTLKDLFEKSYSSYRFIKFRLLFDLRCFEDMFFSYLVDSSFSKSYECKNFINFGFNISHAFNKAKLK